MNCYSWITWLTAANDTRNFRDRKLYLQYYYYHIIQSIIYIESCYKFRNIFDNQHTMLVTPSEFNIIKVPESNDPMSLLIHSNSILQSSYRPPFLILHLASPLFTQDDLQQIVKFKNCLKLLLIYLSCHLLFDRLFVHY